jgi:hypothetical protein
MAFSLTTEAIERQTKTVTRRPVETWRTLKAGDRIVAVDKVMGLKRGQTSRVLGVVRVTDVRVESLVGGMSVDECRREGFPNLTPRGFIDMLAEHYKIKPCMDIDVRRIEFEYLAGDALIAALGEVNQRAAAGRKARERRAAAEWAKDVHAKAGPPC